MKKMNGLICECFFSTFKVVMGMLSPEYVFGVHPTDINQTRNTKTYL